VSAAEWIPLLVVGYLVVAFGTASLFGRWISRR
jgi:hypothetical protein